MSGSVTRVSAHQPGITEGSEPQRAGWGWGRYGGQLEPWRVFDPFKTDCMEKEVGGGGNKSSVLPC